ncbi:MAG TPA: hypothetical protein DHW34_07145 [Actinobacteria bacterium]|nr:hypothetical protein [Actinomycetota bacterium]
MNHAATSWATATAESADASGRDAAARARARTEDPALRVDCYGCTARPHACGDCVVTFLLGAPPAGVHLAADEQVALEVLADAGLVPTLQYRLHAVPDPTV